MDHRNGAARLSFVEEDPHERDDAFARAVEEGLGGAPRSLPCRFLYDEAGSVLFEEICDLPEYYLTRAEHQILEDHADDIAASFDSPIALAELGSGSSTKTRLLIEALLRKQGALRYVPVDISRSILEESARELLSDYRGLNIRAIASEYQEGLRHVRRETDRPKLIAWLGSNVGNFGRGPACQFLTGIRGAMTGSDRLLLGADLRKEASILESAYDDAAGVTARFNLNLLARINSELKADFDVDAFTHRAKYHEDEGRVELSLVSDRNQVVRIEALDLTAGFHANEAIHTEDSYKYSFEELDELARGAGLRIVDRWLDGRGWFSLSLLAAQ